MGKEFVEYCSEKGRAPYSASTICFCLTQYAKEYISEERKAISNIDTKVRDAVLVDAINYLGAVGWCDFALFTEDLYDDKRRNEHVDTQCLLTILQNHYAVYIFNEGIVESVLRNKHMNSCTEPFDANDGAIVLLDFINYIAKRNDFDRTFTIKDLYQKATSQNYKQEMRELKKFLELTGVYTEMLQSGKNIDSIFQEMAVKHNIKFVSRRGLYHYTDDIRKRIGRSHMYPWDVKEIDREVYAMAYAYAKLPDELKQEPQTNIIKQKIKEMQER